MVIEHRRYSTLEEYMQGLRETNISDREIKRLAEHERAHFEKALELGYAPQYALEIYCINPFTRIMLMTSVVFSGKVPIPEHLIKIYLAPKKPSEDDLYLARKLKGRKQK